MLVTSTLFKFISALLVFAIIAYLAASVFQDTLFSFLKKEKTVKIKLVGTPDSSTTCSPTGNYYNCNIDIKNLAIAYGGNTEQEASVVIFFHGITGLATLESGKPIVLKPEGNVFNFNPIGLVTDYGISSAEHIIVGFFKKNEFCEMLAKNNEEDQIFMKQCGKDIIGSVSIWANANINFNLFTDPISITSVHKTQSSCVVSFVVKNTLGYEWKESDNIYLRFLCGMNDVSKKITGLKPDEFIQNPLTQNERTCQKGSLIQIFLYENCNPNYIDSCVALYGTSIGDC